MSQQVKAAVVMAAALLMCVTGSAAQEELDSQVHIQPALREQAKATLPQTQNNDAQNLNLQNVNLQDSSAQNLDPQNQSQTPAVDTHITIPPGTRISMVLSQAISIKHARPGDIVNLQTSFPVVAENQMAIPPGTYVRAVIDKITRRDKSRAVMAMRLRAVDIIFANGYTVIISAPVSIDPVLARFTPADSPPGQPASVLAEIGGVSAPIAMTAATSPTLPPLPPLNDSGIKTTMIVTSIAATAAIVVTGVLMFRHHGYHDDYEARMEAGTPMEIILPAPLMLDTSLVAEAIHTYGERVSRLQAPSAPAAPVFP